MSSHNLRREQGILLPALILKVTYISSLIFLILCYPARVLAAITVMCRRQFRQTQGMRFPCYFYRGRKDFEHV